jgi:L,D-transpeptidase catalytic domain
VAHCFRKVQLNWRFVLLPFDRRAVWLKRNAWGRKFISVFLIALPLGLLPDKSWEVVAGQRLSLNAIPWETRFEFAASKNSDSHHDAEALLREVHRLLSIGQRAEALSASQELVARYPNFQLGQLLFADLLNLTSDQPIDVRSMLGPGAGEATQQRLRQLNDEARLRLTRPDSAVYEGKEPAGLLYLSNKVPFAIVVDASHSRLYVLGHPLTSERSKPTSQGLRVLFQSYMSVGQRGVGKQQRGDGKTPLGAYVTQKSYPGHVLPDLYGSGAVTLSYPNDLDVLDGKTGSGIWIHGSPSEQYARAPESTDGCVVLSNPDMLSLLNLKLPVGTPVFIQNKIEWVDPQKNRNLRAQMGFAAQGRATQDSSEALAMFSWQAEGRKFMVLSADEKSSTGQVGGVITNYWVEKEHQWHAVPVSSMEGLQGHRSSAGVRPSAQTTVR